MTATLASRYELIVLDLDGVVYLGTEAVPSAPAAIRAVLDGGTPVAYATNNASRRATEVARLLQGLGVPARPEEIVTSARASAQLLAGDLAAGSPVLVVGASALAEEIRAVGLTPVFEAAELPVAVVQGFGPDVGWAQLAEAAVAIRSGARWVATNVDATMPSPRGPVPGNGSMVAALRTALGGLSPDTVVGKPEPTLVEVAARGPDGPRHTLVVGDRLDTDVECANRAGMDSLLVLTGVTAPADLLRAAPHQRPSHVAADLTALCAAEDAARVPAWRTQASCGGWRTTLDGDHLRLAGAGEPAAALRALAAAAWAHPEWTAVVPDGAGASAALESLGLTQFVGWSVTGASSA